MKFTFILLAPLSSDSLAWRTHPPLFILDNKLQHSTLRTRGTILKTRRKHRNKTPSNSKPIKNIIKLGVKITKTSETTQFPPSPSPPHKTQAFLHLPRYLTLTLTHQIKQ
ncbi:hypothetical protein BKA61DRAFT_9413 [Leptodontidium sp. MPI-SDFR-AT-0119]|nr:hypothetical protein BKA61DRAFT_9413 [Leptodontidium sp. MPI-SDFR-AT-0119]